MSRTYRSRLVLPGTMAIATCVAAALACGNPSGEGNGCAGTGAHTVINAQDNQAFVPNLLTVSAGETVCWQNNGSVAHTVTAVSVSGVVDSSWTPDSVNAQLNHGSLYVRAFTRINANYFYKCSLHANMTGQIQVR